MELQEKKRKLEEYLKSLGGVLVAFSGGVDSAFLLKVAHDVLGEKAVAMTATSAWMAERECKEAEEFCKKYGIRHVILPAEMEEIAGFHKNTKERCYLCKRALFRGFQKGAERLGLTVVEGSNMDDEGDYRPGLRAIAELGVKSPLRYAGLYKKDIRALSEAMGLSTWNKPSFACLASRIPYGEELTEEKLAQVEAAEAFLSKEGFQQFRVRLHGNLARIELLPEDIPRMLDENLRKRMAEKCKALGIAYTALDLIGYRMGSLNENILK